MAFSHPILRAFNEHGIWVHAPAVPGIFGVSNSRRWIRVGRAANIREALLDCLQGQDSAFLDCGPTGFVFEPCPNEVQANRGIQLIGEYHPVCQPQARSDVRLVP